LNQSASPPPAVAPGLPGILPALARLLSGTLLARSGALARLGPRQILVSRSSRFILSKREWRTDHRQGEYGHA